MSNNIDRPLKDRMKAAYLKEDMADIHFSEQIPGHKLLLATASEVFCGMLYGHFEVPETIDVDDTTPDAFKAMLSYIYTDEVDLSPGNAFPVLYLAKKYLLNSLMAEVSTYIATAYNGESIAKVLPQLHLVDEENAESVWKAIELKADVVLKSPEFLELSHADLCDLLRRDLDVDEITVYDSVLAWAQAECDRMQVSFERNAREVLGNALKLIRFPLMSIEEFSSGPAKSSILSDKKQLEVYRWYGLRATQELTTFLSIPRKRALLSCNRFDASSVVSENGGNWANPRDCKYCINFEVTAPVRVHGVAFFGRKGVSTAYEVDLALLDASSGETLAFAHAELITDAKEVTYKVFFDRPVLISPGPYKLTAVSIGPNSMYAKDGQRKVTCDNAGSAATFTFTDTGSRRINEFDVTLRGHIPIIYFSFP